MATRTPIEGSIESSVLPVLVSAMERLSEEAAKAADEQIAEMCSTFEEAHSKLSRERDTAERDAQDRQIELAGRDAQIADLRQTIKHLRSDLADEKRRGDRLSRRIAETERDFAKATAAAEATEAAASAKVSGLETQLADNQQTLNALIEKIGT